MLHGQRLLYDDSSIPALPLLMPSHLLNDGVVCESHPVALHLCKASLVHQLPHALLVGVAPGNVGLHPLEQAHGGGIQLR